MKIKTTPFVLNNGYNVCTAEFFYAGFPFKGWYKVRIGADKPYIKSLGKVYPGENKKEIYLTDTNKVLNPGECTSLSVEVYDNKRCSGAPKIEFKTNTWQRTRHWEFYYSQMMHTDLGYTNPQEDLPELYSGYLDTVQDFIKKSDNGDYGEIPYKYSVESSWMLDGGYMKKRSARQIQNIADKVNNGSMSIGAGRFNYTMECFSAEETARAAYYTNRYMVDKLGVAQSNTIRMFDNPAFSKSFIDIAAASGIKYGIHSMNPDRSPYHKKRLFDLFYMEGFNPENRMLVFNERSYGFNYGFGGSHWDSYGSNVNGAEKNLLKTIELLEKRTGRESYPYDKFPLPLIPFGDNKPPMEKQIEVVNGLNALWKKHGYAYPKIKAAFPDEFFEDVEREYKALIPVETGTEENWWNDGWGTAAHESGINKAAGTLIPQAETLSAVNSAFFGDSYPYEEIYEASQRNITYDEHTFGYWLYSDDENYHGQFEWKRSNAMGAMALAKKRGENAMKAFAAHVGENSVTVLNLSSASRTDIVSVNAAELPEYFNIYDGGEKIPFNINGDKVEFIASDVPQFGYKNFKIEKAERPSVFSQICRYGKDFIENEFYKIQFNKDGSIASILDKEEKRELVDSKAAEGFNQYRYYDDFGIPFSNMGAPFTPDKWSVYSPKAENTVMKPRVSDIGAEMVIDSKTFRARSIRQSVKLYNGIKRIDIINEVVKEHLPSLKNIEEGFFTFPFKAKNHEIKYGLPIGKVKEGEQVYGTSHDWYSVNNQITVTDKADDYHMILAVPNAILAQFGERRTGKWSFDYVSKKPCVYSYVYNNMWQTNFQGDQPGYTCFKYSITSGKGKLFDDGAVKFGESAAAPMLSAVSVDGKGKKQSDSLIKFNRENVDVTVIKTAESNGDGMIIRFNEKCGWDTENVKVTLPESFVAFCETDIIENDISEMTDGNVITFSIPAYGVRTFRILTDKKVKKAAAVKAVSDAHGTVVTFRKVSGAEYYEIFRAENENKEIRWVGTTTESAWRDIQVRADDCKNYRYFVRACASGIKGEFSAPAVPQAGEPKHIVPDTPVLTVLPREENRLDLSWAPDCKGVALRYEVYRDGKKIAETKDAHVCSYRDRKVYFGETYVYKIVTIGLDGALASSEDVEFCHSDSRFKQSLDSVVTVPRKNPMRKFYEKVIKR